VRIYERRGAWQLAPAVRQTIWALGIIPLLVASALLALLGHMYVGSQHTVWIEIGGHRLAHRTHEHSADAVLREMGLELTPLDLSVLPSSDDLLSGEPIRIIPARPVTLVRGDEVVYGCTHGETPIEALSDLGISLRPDDRLYLDGQPYSPYAALPSVIPAGRLRADRVLASWRRTITLRLERAVPLTVYEGDAPHTFFTTARTVGQALREQGYTIYAGDDLTPSMGSRVRPGQAIYLRRATPVVLDVGGRARTVRTHARTIDALLKEQNVLLGEQDYVQPDVESAITPHTTVRVVRVADQHFVEEKPVPYQVVEVPDPQMEIDTREITRWGHEGAQRQRIRVHYENGQEVYRTVVDEWLEREPLDRIISYGTKIVLRELQTPHGTYTYWRRLRMLATSYSASTAGTPVSSPYYGLTRLGWPARKGIIAVDPRVIPLEQRMYVPGYGPGIAGDTGGAINWRRIDLCYDDDNLVLWHQWVDVYLLTPVPPRNQILWQVPNLPAEWD